MFHLLLYTFYLFVTPFVDIEDRNQGSICWIMIKCPVVLEVNTNILLFVSLLSGNLKFFVISDVFHLLTSSTVHSCVYIESVDTASMNLCCINNAWGKCVDEIIGLCYYIYIYKNQLFLSSSGPTISGRLLVHPNYVQE